MVRVRTLPVLFVLFFRLFIIIIIIIIIIIYLFFAFRKIRKVLTGVLAQVRALMLVYLDANNSILFSVK